MSELLPCPFCGGAASDRGHTHYEGDSNAWFADGTKIVDAFFVSCIECGATDKGLIGGFQTKEEAIKHWNKRA